MTPLSSKCYWTPCCLFFSELAHYFFSVFMHDVTVQQIHKSNEAQFWGKFLLCLKLGK